MPSTCTPAPPPAPGAIDLAFARWDLAHLHEFESPDGRRYGIPNDEFVEELGAVIDYEQVRAGAILTKGEPLTYVFDLGDNWRHRCWVEHSGLDPERMAGIVPQKPIPIWVWGWISDQCGRRWEGDDGSEDGPCPLCGKSWSEQ